MVCLGEPCFDFLILVVTQFRGGFAGALFPPAIVIFALAHGGIQLSNKIGVILFLYSVREISRVAVELSVNLHLPSVVSMTNDAGTAV